MPVLLDGPYASEACHPPGGGGAIPVKEFAASTSGSSVLGLTFLSDIVSTDLGERTLATADGSTSGCVLMVESVSCGVLSSC